MDSELWTGWQSDKHLDKWQLATHSYNPGGLYKYRIRLDDIRYHSNCCSYAIQNRTCSSGSGVACSPLVSNNEVNLRRARLVLGWVTTSGFNSRCGTFISVCNQPPRSTQPGHPFVGRRNLVPAKGRWCLFLRLMGSKSSYGSCVGGYINSSVFTFFTRIGLSQAIPNCVTELLVKISQRRAFLLEI